VSRQRRLFQATLALLVFPFSCSLTTEDQTMSDLTLATPEVIIADSYAIGLPIYVAVIISGQPGATYNGLPSADLFEIDDCIAVELKLPGEVTPISSYVPSPELDSDLTGSSGHRLRPGERRRMLVDISPFVMLNGPPAADRYVLRVAYVSDDGPHWSPPLGMVLREPVPAELAALGRVAPTRSEYGSWSQWIAAAPIGESLEDDSGAPSPLRFASLLRALLHHPGGRAAVGIPSPGSFGPLLEPEVLALSAETANARGDTALAASLEASLRQTRPDLQWWADIISMGGSVVPRPGG
jgi:hypothetical protein